ncbi:MAG: type III secretion system protein [Deltaproteobacteria bacterium]|nr:type III secretion system protein [Deltaproteobacteria bacterium]
MGNELTISRFQTGNIDAATALRQLTEGQPTGLGSTLPPAAGDITLNQALEKLGLPVLSTPVGGMSLDSLMNAIGNEVRRQACKDGVNSLELKAAQQKEVNDKQLEQLAKQLEEMKKKAVLNGFLKAFKIIGMIVGAIASVATIAAGVLTGNPLLVVAGCIGMAMTIDSVLSMATDGKVCMMAGFEKLGKAMGMSDETAKWFAFGMQMAVMVAAIGVSIGAGLASTSASAANITSQAAQKAFDVTVLAQKVLNFTSAGLNVAQGGTTIASAVVDYKVAQTKITAKELEAILERIKEAIEMDRKLVENEMERANDLMAKVTEIVKGCAETQTAILTTTPAMA